MGKAQVKIGESYHARIGGNHTVVTLLDAFTAYGGREHYHARNESTGRVVTIKSTVKLRREASVDEVIQCRLKQK